MDELRDFVHRKFRNKLKVSGSYIVGELGDEKKLFEGLCLVRTKSKNWNILYTERGMVQQLKSGLGFVEALREFFSLMNGPLVSDEDIDGLTS